MEAPLLIIQAFLWQSFQSRAAEADLGVRVRDHRFTVITESSNQHNKEFLFVCLPKRNAAVPKITRVSDSTMRTAVLTSHVSIIGDVDGLFAKRDA